MKVKSICILGGGTSGFAMSAALARFNQLCGLDIDVRVVHSESIGSIGVGESTIVSINELLKYLGLEDSDWMKDCNATYKTSIRFEDFYKKGTHFHYPFGRIHEEQNTLEGVNQWFINKEVFPSTYTPERAAYYFVASTMLAEKNKLVDDSNYDLETNTAYHFDSHLFAKFLKLYSEDGGVEVIDDTFKSATLREDGSIKSLVCENGTYEADLFIDCSGFRSLLLGGVMGEEYVSYGDTLINNKVLRANVPYKRIEKELKNYTNCVALKNGWCWEIPLWDKMSVGYVHTNKFATEEEIEKEFFDHVGEVEYDIVEFKTGRYKRGWVKNVVAVGLSYGFVEPLESTGIATTLMNLFRVVECLSKREMTYTQIDRDLFNYDIPKNIDGFRSLVELHYYLSSRDESDYWKYLTEDISYDNLPFLKATGDSRTYYEGGNSNPASLFIVAGMNYSCFSKAFVMRKPNEAFNKNKREFENYVKELERNVERLPSTYKFLLKHIY
jgi:tryptophan halogenase